MWRQYGVRDQLRRIAGFFHRVSEHLITAVARAGRPELAKTMLKIQHGVTLRRGRQQRLLSLSSVTNWARECAAPVKSLLPRRIITLPPIKTRGAGLTQMFGVAMQVELPPVNIYIFENVEVVGGTEMMLAEGHRLIYDELAFGDPNKFGNKAFGILVSQGFGLHLPAFAQDRVLLSHMKFKGRRIEKCIFLCKDHSSNYYHWILECMPRAIIALQDSDFRDFPLLIDENLPSQNLEALQLLAGDREIINLSRRECCNVVQLIYPDVFSFMHDNYGPVSAPDDLVIAPESVKLIREALVKPATRMAKRLFVARDGAKYRRLRNELQLQGLAERYGFEIVHPEKLSFMQQVDLFSSAAFIVGPTGAGMTNIVFAPLGCKVVVLAGATNGANFNIFGQLGKILEHELEYLAGCADNSALLHSDYRIEPDLLEKLFREAGLERCKRRDKP